MVAKIAAGVLINNELLMGGVILNNTNEYKLINDMDIKKDTSQIRRCQKRVNVTGFIVILPCLLMIYFIANRYYDDCAYFLQALGTIR